MKLGIKVFAIATLFSLLSHGQNVKEGIQNSKQIIEGKKSLERDSKELNLIQAKVLKLRSAFNDLDNVKVNELKTSILLDFEREVAQSEVKAKKARREISQSSAEIRSDRREIRGNREDSENGRFDRRDDKRDMARDKANKRDDRRDRRDDIRDFEMQLKRAEEQAIILNTLKSFQFDFTDDNSTVNQSKLELIDRFLITLKDDIEATKRELGEDSREMREDRRERRDDRNERNEIDSKRKKRW